MQNANHPRGDPNFSYAATAFCGGIWIAAAACGLTAAGVFSLVSASLSLTVIALVLAIAALSSTMKAKSVRHGLAQALLIYGAKTLSALLLANSALIPAALSIFSPIILLVAQVTIWIYPLAMTYTLMKSGLMMLKASFDIAVVATIASKELFSQHHSVKGWMAAIHRRVVANHNDLERNSL